MNYGWNSLIFTVVVAVASKFSLDGRRRSGILRISIINEVIHD